MKTVLGLAILLTLIACAGDDGITPGQRYVAERDALIDGLAIAITQACVSYEVRTGKDGCADGRIDLDKWGEDIPPSLASARNDYCDLIGKGGTYAAVGQVAATIAVNRHLRKRDVPVFAESVCA